ncbi:ADP-ribosyltransferase domain-containing protein [Saccharicrinis aurantiacus]|uniref:ADP-ribosyltransferase domain-containing protein n=1 Tax=Saccharicrinis aurantiacus TaxID=1849719 RepID=UPI000838FCC4|nr:ADP-ribosyltransferase domain-containing protein [Saccharicrinis aurantiacus]
MKKALYILLLLLLSFTTKAQSNYPIYVTPTLTPPYSLKLSDYSAIGSQNLVVQVIVNDLNIVDLPIKLRIKMETAGVTIENPPTYTTTPIFLNGGVTTILFGEDLVDNFNVNNLIFKGYSKDAYLKTGQLPGGFYKFTVEVLHFNTNRLISNSGSTSAWIELGKPPLLQAPLHEAEAGQIVGMPITFSWLESNVGSPGAKGSIQYLFEMWEMRVQGINPNTIAQSMPVFHEYTTFNHLYPLYPSTLLMEPGMQYAWRVTASDVSGLVPFEQDGHSEIRTFIYKAKCDNATNIASEVKGKNGTFTWDASENHTSFNIEVQQPQTSWFLNSETFDAKASYFDLEPGQTYQIRVQGVCNGDPQQVSDYSAWHSLTVPEPKPLIDSEECPTCGCDDDIPEVELTNFELKTVEVGDTIVNKNGTTRFIVRSVKDDGANTYSGVFLFWAEIWSAKIVCNYESLQVNTDNVIVNMKFESVYDPQYLANVDVIEEYINNLADDVAELTTSTTVKDSITIDKPFDQIYVKGDSVMAVTVNDDGSISEAFVSTTDNLDKTLITGSNGEQVVITGDGKAMGLEEFKNTGGNSRLVSNNNSKKEEDLPTDNSMVSFSPSSNQQYGFDAYSDIKQLIQHNYPALNNGYRPAFKSVAAFGTDKITASSTQGLSFRDQMGIPAIGNSSELNIRGSFGGAQVPLYAYRMQADSTEQVVGKLQMLSYTPQSKKLYIVQVNGASMPNESALQSTLNNIYAQALTTWQVQNLNTNLSVNFANGKMTHGGSSAFTTYNTDQKAILSAFELAGHTFERDASYLFFIDNVQDKDKSIAGYMPLQRQAGFIYDNPNLNIIAHELAHGAFNLYHTFSDNLKIANEGETQNLMDYKGGTELWKHQWDLIHDPSNVMFAWGQDEKEGEKVLIGNDEKLIGLIEKLRCSFKTQVPFSYKKPLGFVNNVKVFDNIKLYDSYLYDEITLVIADDIENYLPTEASVRNVQGKFAIELNGFSFYVKDEEAANNLKKYIFNTTDADWITHQAKLLAQLTNAINSSDDEDLIINTLYTLSPCSYSEMTNSARHKSLEVMAGQWLLPGWNEKIVVDLVASALDNSNNARSLYDYFKQNPEILYNLYSGSDEYRSHFVELCSALMAMNWTNDELYSIAFNRYYIIKSKQLFVRSSFDKANGIDIWSKWNDTYEMITEVKGLFALEPIGLALECDNCSESNINYVPAIFLQSLVDKSDEESIELLINGALTFAGGYGSINLIANGSRIGKIIGAIELLNLTADGIVTSPLVRNQLMLTNGGKEFLEYWPYIKMTVDLATVSTDILTTFATNGRKVGNTLSTLPDAEAQKILSRIDDAEDVLKRRGVLVNVGGDFAHFLDDGFVLTKRAEVIADGLPSQFPNLSIDEITAIKVYTSDEVRNGVKIYRELNAQLRVGSNLDGYYRGLNKLLNDGLGKMTPHNGSLVYRGCGQAESQLAKNWKVGDEITFKDFKSSSVKENVALKFMNDQDGDVIYEISNPKGYNICEISCLSNEAEIFFKSGSKFNVDELTFQPRFTESDPIVKVIKLTYIP